MKEHIKSFLTTHIIHSSYVSYEFVNRMSERLFTSLTNMNVQEEEDVIQLCLDVLPVNRSTFNNINITSDMVIEILNAYILDGGIRDFKNILDPDSEVIVSDSESDDDKEHTHLQHIHYSYDTNDSDSS